MAGERDNNVWAQVGRYSSIAMILPSCTFVGYAIGYLLDRWLATRWLSMIFLLVGIAAGFLQLLRELQKDTRNGNR